MPGAGSKAGITCLPRAAGWGSPGGVTGVGMAEGARWGRVKEPRSLPKELPCVGGGFSPEPELSQSRRLARARLPAASRRPGPPPAARLGRQRRDGAYLFASFPGPTRGWWAPEANRAASGLARQDASGTEQQKAEVPEVSGRGGGGARTLGSGRWAGLGWRAWPCK